MIARHFAIPLILPLLLAPASTAAVFSGSVTKVRDDRVHLKVADETMTFQVNEQTKITLNGREAALEEILPGHTAKINARKRKDAWIARSLAARLAPMTTPELRPAGERGTDWHTPRERAKIEVLRPSGSGFVNTHLSGTAPAAGVLVFTGTPGDLRLTGWRTACCAIGGLRRCG